MAKAYKNFWSLNIDEAIVAGILRDETSKGIEVLMPLNAQMKDVDLVLADSTRKKIYTVQVKGSRAYEPRKSETEKFGDGSAGWFFFPRKVLNKSTADFFVFLIYVIEQSKKSGRRIIRPHLITLPTRKLQELARRHKTPHGADRYSFIIWVNPKTKTAFDFRDKHYDLSDYLDKKGIQKIR